MSQTRVEIEGRAPIDLVQVKCLVMEGIANIEQLLVLRGDANSAMTGRVSR